MNELIQMIVQKTGISEEHARTAADTALNYIKGKLPPAVAQHIDSAISGAPAGESGGFAGVASGISGMFGQK
jgi:hypothetical protein